MNYIYSNGELRDDVFVGKLGTSQDYTWLWEGQEDIQTLSDEQIREYVKVKADILHDMYTAECHEANNGEGVEPLLFEKFLNESDFENAVQAFIKYRNTL